MLFTFFEPVCHKWLQVVSLRRHLCKSNLFNIIYICEMINNPIYHSATNGRIHILWPVRGSCNTSFSEGINPIGMSPNVHRRMLFYLSNLTMFAIFTSLLTGFNLIQFEKSDQLTRIGVPRPRQTEAEWCSAVLLGHADSDSSTVEDLLALVCISFSELYFDGYHKEYKNVFFNENEIFTWYTDYLMFYPYIY